jgi:hypothetical protein
MPQRAIRYLCRSAPTIAACIRAAFHSPLEAGS